jgi:hypothetical protein
MEIQYVMFCKTIGEKGIVLRNPINKIGVSDASHFQKIRLPLLVTFLGGSKGKHLLNVHIIPRGFSEAEITEDFHFDWPGDSALYTKTFGLEFKPKFHTIYDFLFEVDGQILAKIPLPIEKGRQHR